MKKAIIIATFLVIAISGWGTQLPKPLETIPGELDNLNLMTIKVGDLESRVHELDNLIKQIK